MENNDSPPSVGIRRLASHCQRRTHSKYCNGRELSATLKERGETSLVFQWFSSAPSTSFQHEWRNKRTAHHRLTKQPVLFSFVGVRSEWPELSHTKQSCCVTCLFISFTSFFASTTTYCAPPSPSGMTAQNTHRHQHVNKWVPLRLTVLWCGAFIYSSHTGHSAWNRLG